MRAPTGVGKTTFARANLSAFINQQAFLNADDIARTANPSDVEAVAIEAGRTLLRRRRKLIAERLSFCTETTLATRTLLRSIEEARAVSYRVTLIFLFTPFANINELRSSSVSWRVATTSIPIRSVADIRSA